MIQVPWWGYILFLIAVAIAVWGFLSMVGFRTRYLSSKTYRTPESLYPNHAELTRKQRREARAHATQEPDRAGSSHPSEGAES